jgi:hypothetical protein
MSLPFAPAPIISTRGVLECIGYFCLDDEELIDAAAITPAPPSRFALHRATLLRDALDWVGMEAFKRSVERVTSMAVMGMGVDIDPKMGCPTSATLRLVGAPHGRINIVILLHRHAREISIMAAYRDDALE